MQMPMLAAALQSMHRPQGGMQQPGMMQPPMMGMPQMGQPPQPGNVPSSPGMLGGALQHAGVMPRRVSAPRMY